MKRILFALLAAAAAVNLGGCVLTKVVSVPMRAAGAVISVVPVAGNTAHDVIDEAADAVDKVPI
ncbi:hypothetical protein G3N55_01685 [Dissulfurirhabdus thermomarina]|uniref:Uncharacterized protein n=1 Tax=Dissulfurirhabdus thermomarina TaxID=1765737 RepID=A0A6N9TNB4_DISTH|nr:DUF6726 family protein [Dissulfurirhabdus thermomarina]NDY41563.1 hypothetical protein [Dissulfurirhabdus thermomarina]NMX22382.1 hypothetical protein [Dissulfurirhabdus thermomarina]